MNAWCLIFGFVFAGGIDDLRFQHIKERDGLPHITVSSIKEDSLGFLWLVTEDGLARYDGYSFQAFKPNPLDKNSIVGKVIQGIMLVGRGDVWIHMKGRGLNKFNFDTETFTYFGHDPDNPHSLSNNNIQSTSFDRHGKVWVGTYDGLNQVDPETHHIRRFYGSDSGESVSGSWISFTTEDPQGRMWIGTHQNGLNFIEQQDGSDELSFVHYRHDPNDPHSLAEGRVLYVLQTRDGLVWVGTPRGLSRLDQTSGKFQNLPLDPDHPEDQSRNAVLNIFEDRAGRLWLQSRGGRLLRYDRETGAMIRYEARSDRPDSLSHENARVIYEGPSGTVWIGTNGGGLNRYLPERDGFIAYRHDPENPSSLSSDNVTTLYEQANGTLYVGTWLGGLNKYVPATRRFGHHRHEARRPMGLPDARVTSFFEPPGKEGALLWLGTRDGLHLLDRKQGVYTAYRHNPTNPEGLGSRIVRTVLGDTDPELIWVGTSGNGLNRLHLPSGRFKRFTHDPNDPDSFGCHSVFSTYLDRSGTLWVGTWDHGLDRFDRERERFIHYQPGGQPGALLNPRVTCMLEDPDGAFWVGTDTHLHQMNRQTGVFTAYDPYRNGLYGVQAIVQADEADKLWVASYTGGLHLFDKGTGDSIAFTEEEGLCHNSVLGLSQDSQGRLWAATANGLSRFDPATQRFNNYDDRDGLQGNRFFWTACYRGGRGELFLGGRKGFNAFFPEQIFDDPNPPLVVFSDFKLANVSQKTGPGSPLDVHIKATERITLNHAQNAFSFQFTGLHPVRPERITYAHMMEGFETEWNHVGTSRDARFTNLAPGAYIFRVKAANRDGVWGDPSAVEVVITPPFWHTSWFYGLEIVLGLALLRLLFRRQHRVMEQRRQQELMAHDLDRKTREKELAEAANRSKTRFLANMSHEIRSPLNAIVGFSRILIRRARDRNIPEEFKHYLENIRTSGENLSELINNILDLSKIEAGKMAISREDLNLALLVQGIFHIFKQKAGEKGLSFSYRYDGGLDQMVNCDRTRLNQILVNLIDNAIKFTPTGKSVRISAFREQDSIVLTVEDQGIGIAKDKQATVFAPFEQADGTTNRDFGGTGLGLSITARMVDLLGGELTLDSELGKGSCFSVRLPFVAASGMHSREVASWLDVRFAAGNRVLVVDDNGMNREMAQALFREMGLEVDLAEGGAEGVAMAFELSPDLIIMDLHMPGVNGFEALRRIRTQLQGKDLPIVAFSADAFREQQEAALAAGFNAFLSKPLEMGKLIPLLKAHLREEDPAPIRGQGGPDLPPELEHNLREELRQLAEIPHFMTGNIIDKLKQMNRLCSGYSSPWPDLLNRIEKATYARDAATVSELIAKGLA